jgi:uncharacterized protein DUF3592
MPLVRKQLKSDPVAQRLAVHSTFEFRKFAALGWFCAVFGTAGVAAFGRGVSAWIAGCCSTLIATIGIYRLRKECLLLRDYETVAATVSQWTKADGPDGGYVYFVRYRFLGSDGKIYFGKSGTTDRELAPEGSTVPVLYKRTDPSQNEALATFWFHHFTYTGTE